MSSNENTSEPSSSDKLVQDQQQKALKVPIDALVSYLNRIAPGNKCGFCKTGEYGVVPAPSGGTAGVVASPVPNVQHLGVWFFFATCTTCGHTAFFNAPFVLSKMLESH